MHSGERPALLCISQSFFPDTTPTAIRAGKLLERLSGQWDVAVVTEAQGGQRNGRMRVEVVHSWQPRRLLAALQRLRLSKLLEMAVWPDESIFWVVPAILAGRRLARERAPSAIVVFMMPYSTGLAGLALRSITGLPLILNLDDSLTCTDMHPYFPTRLHYRLARALEDLYVRRADASVYVSQTNLEAVRARQPQEARAKLHLVRYAADATALEPHSTQSERFEIAYVGAMSGWWALIDEHAPAGRLKRIYAAWLRLGRHRRTVLDQRTSSPAFIGRAMLDAIAERPDWTGRLGLTLYGNPYAADVVARALASVELQSVVTVLGPMPHDQVADILASADLLFLTLPARADGSRGGRISAKTYEYLTTDRPILAAVPAGENWDYLVDKPGVWLVEPHDQQRMREVITELALEKFAGRARTFDRADLVEELSYETRAAEFAGVVRAAIERRRGSQAAKISPR